MIPTGFHASLPARHQMELLLGAELMDVLQDIGTLAYRASVPGRRTERREMRRIRLWLGPVYWRALCLMLNEGRIMDGRPVVGSIRSHHCRDALVLVMELQAERERWGMP